VSAEYITTGDASGVLAEDGIAKGEQVTDAAISGAIVDLLAVTACLDEVTPP
jgi:hypothetical protein